jgi:tetratricopeptide (TPR) repeat protein
LCVERFPESAAAHLLLCGALTELNCFEDARECLEQAISLDVDGKEALQIAQRQRPLGLIDDANQNLRRAIRTNPRLVQAYDTLIQNQRTTEDDRGLVEHMEALLADRRLAAIETISLHYALGKAREELGEFQDSAHHLDEANRLTRDLKFGETRFDRDRYAAHVDELIREFLPMARSSIAWSTCQERLPILIVGMMRSGTTLAEQILSSHPAVGAAGEQLFWTRNWRRTLEAGAERSQMVAQLGQEYVQFLGGLCPGVARVTDKMPGNCMFAGLIHAALPQAKIVHMRRNPLDNCLSIWATPNQMPHEGGHVKDEIVFVYRQYLRLMEETRRSIPPERLLEIDYEELVADQEATTRRMLEFCELEWDERCLRPEDNTRTVLTPSAWQVRQPVYRTSVARWRNFEPYLGPFGDLIGLEHPRGLA